MNKMMLDDATRYHLLKLLTEHPESTQRELAAAMGVSLGKTNYCLKALVDKGLVKMGNFRSNPNKGVYAYLLTPEGVQEKSPGHRPLPAAENGRIRRPPGGDRRPAPGSGRPQRIRPRCREGGGMTTAERLARYERPFAAIPLSLAGLWVD